MTSIPVAEGSFSRPRLSFDPILHAFPIGLSLIVAALRLVLWRVCAAPSARLGHLTFEGRGAFPSQC